MKKTIVAALAAALMSSGAYAADAFDKGSTKDAGIFSAPAVVNWSGIYIGGAVGYGNANHDLSLRDYWKDYCDFGKYDSVLRPGTGTAVYDNTLRTGDRQIDEADAQKDPNRFFNHGTEALEGCSAPAASTPNQVRRYAPIGIEKGDSREIGHLDGLNTSGLVGDGRIGFDVQRGRFVFGVFGAYGFNNMEADGGIEGLGSFTLEKGDEWSVGARAGILGNPRTLAYIMAAYTQTDYDLTLHGSGEGADSVSRETTFDGITVGAGVEFAVTNNVFLGIEGSHTFYGEEALFDHYDAESNVGTRLNDKLGETRVMGTLKLKLNTGLGGVID